MELLYDASHNYIWKKEIAGEDYYVHRCSDMTAGAGM